MNDRIKINEFKDLIQNINTGLSLDNENLHIVSIDFKNTHSIGVDKKFFDESTQSFTTDDLYSVFNYYIESNDTIVTFSINHEETEPSYFKFLLSKSIRSEQKFHYSAHKHYNSLSVLENNDYINIKTLIALDSELDDGYKEKIEKFNSLIDTWSAVNTTKIKENELTIEKHDRFSTIVQKLETIRTVDVEKAKARVQQLKKLYKVL